MKKIPLLSNLFSRSRSNAGTLETDALPVDDPPESRSRQHSLNNGSLNSGDFNAALQLHNQMAESSDLTVARTNSNNQVVEASNNGIPQTTITNNQMAVQNTQGQVVMQFSNVNGLQFGSNYTFNSGKLEQTLSPESSSAKPAPNNGRLRRTRTIEAMMKSTEELDHKMMVVISTHLGEGWKNVLRDLGYTDGQIEQSIIDNQIQGGVKEVIYQLLLGWTNNAEEGEATLGLITQILWKSNHRECVQKMKEVWKLTNSQQTT
ncbi:protein immune deficiency [Episyrphus balteatus]|uniref:protein immune deficiency n=1 Tax=Episyrphus balteatus TaxID=286459 RepID=UPI0024862E7F|nr:protein immune deficiency [Episyrphus balteatus]